MISSEANPSPGVAALDWSLHSGNVNEGSNYPHACHVKHRVIAAGSIALRYIEQR